jgi:drug/metabolite transporter (DMT)-like permease
MQVPIVALLAWWLFAETVTVWTAVGAAIIFAANAYIAHREARLAARTVTDREISAETQKP